MTTTIESLTLSQGQEATRTLLVGQSITVTGTGEMAYRSRRLGRRRLRLSAVPQSVGPFVEDIDVRLVAAGAVSATVSDMAARLGVAPALWSDASATALVRPDGTVAPVVIRAYSQGGRIAAPVASFDGAGISGRFATAGDLLVPANTLVPGTSRIKVRVRVRKVGADASSFLQVHFGPLNSTSDPNIFGAQTPAFTSVNPFDSTLIYEGVVSSGGLSGSWTFERTNVGLTLNVSEQATLNTAADNFFSIAISGASATNTYGLIDYNIEVFR